MQKAMLWGKFCWNIQNLRYLIKTQTMANVAYVYFHLVFRKMLKYTFVSTQDIRHAENITMGVYMHIHLLLSYADTNRQQKPEPYLTVGNLPSASHQKKLFKPCFCLVLNQTG